MKSGPLILKAERANKLALVNVFYDFALVHLGDGSLSMAVPLKRAIPQDPEIRKTLK